MNRFDARSQKTAVGFELSFPRSSQTNPPFLTLKVRPAANQSCRHILKLSELYLQLTLVGTRTLSEDVENQTGTVKNAARERPFKVTLLGR